MHQRLQKRGPWLDHEGEIPLIHGTLVRLKVEHPPGERDAEPLWPWSSATGVDAEHPDRTWRTFLRRLDDIRAKTPSPAAVSQPTRPGPARPPGSKNHRPAPRYDVGKTTKREPTLEAHLAKIAATA